jgi:hypothetical protein
MGKGVSVATGLPAFCRQETVPTLRDKQEYRLELINPYEMIKGILCLEWFLVSIKLVVWVENTENTEVILLK